MHKEDMEQLKIREFLKTLTVMDIANSTHLYGFDFETCDISDVVDAMFSLFCEVKTLERMVREDFRGEGDEKVLLPSSLETKNIVAKDYYRKCSAMSKLLDCKELSDLFKERLVDDLLEHSDVKHRSN